MSQLHATSRLAGLDGLRAIAILLVIAYHSAMRWPMTLPPVLKEFIHQGKFGVTIFFVLSGFLITHLLCMEERKVGSIGLGRFYFRRAFRILPPAFFYLAVVGVLVLLGAVTLPASDLVYCGLFVRNLAYQLFGPVATAHFWSLAIEEQFYLVWPLVFLTTRGRQRIEITAVLVVLAPVWRAVAYHWGVGYDAYPVRTDLLYDSLLIGCLLALLRADPRAGRIMRGPILQHPNTLLAGVVVVLITGFFHEFIPPVADSIRLSLAFAAIALCINYLVEGHHGPVTWLLGTVPMVWIGRLSFSLYLWQQLFILREGSMGTTDQVGVWGDLSLTLLMACLSYFAVETPFLRWRDRIGRRQEDVVAKVVTV